ncbi:ribosome small subunit-dependent GTPase A [Mesobacillus maritimus]|uniref:ribosome small subunit-dependent GTPase A n=1 Tax=Mesobacillus maritimus TaxID=1643336 RepID=UPI00203B778B|nr:ribosome small subunit-dependent GTPase A [Mesobacillus maritimus]MCM3587141.1 ribosome small subunit-dependent GTPase A [Mesobacillus maritimus]MCM3667706.1 ribosome small subunit-dependent GTPase A [Mesobacillus maritimus]
MPQGKIVKALSGFYYVLGEEGLVQCRGRGVFRKNKVNPLVGDEVVYQAENSTEGYIMEVKERRNELVRPPIANVDQAILVFSAVEPEFSTALLDRFLVLVEYNHIQPLIVITKVDLLEEGLTVLEQYASDYREAGYDVIFTSSETAQGLEDLSPYLAGKISVFAGQSGVGKSSLLNALEPELELKTNDISQHLGRGRHTTRHVELINIGNSGLVADTPGFSSLEFTDIEATDLNYCFPDIERISENCKFRGCLHVSEPKCAVKAAVEAEELPTYRYEHYKDFLQEIKDRKPRY